MTRIDLHAHTEHSDGTLSPAALARLARDVGLALLAVTDHDTSTAHMTIKLAVRDLEQLAELLRRLAGVPNVISARRML